MRILASFIVAGFLMFGVGPADARVTTGQGYQDKVVEHGGGCRKNSPPGMCCHMDRKAGTVHCH